MMKRLSGLIFVIATGYTGICATRSLLPGNADRGKDLFRTLNCGVCHSIGGEGGKSAPDLGRGVERGFSPYVLAGLLWNHAPVMWAAMERQGVAKPELSEQQAADLFVYFFAARYFEQLGDARRGERVFLAKRCVECHGIGSALREGIQPVSAWKSLADPIALAQQMWNHSWEMKPVLDRMKIPYPRFSAQELTDLLVYLRSTQGPGHAGDFSPGSVESGEELFVVKGCAGCHKKALTLEARPTRYSLTDFAAAMWNHPLRALHSPAPLSYEEMRRLVGYLVSTQFFEERGDLEQGKKVFARKRCGACHDDPSSGAPGRSAMAGRMTSFEMVAALWKHGPAMLNRMRLKKIPWPRFSGSEMADLTAYLHGFNLKQRRPLIDPARHP
jgi:mono/diheme cytochrome c family protein